MMLPRQVGCLVLLTLLGGLQGIVGEPTGAPEAACVDMMPQHIVPPQTTEPPYTLTYDDLGDGTYEITLGSSNGYPFRGFFIQVRLESEIMGSFSIPDTSLTKERPCPSSAGVPNAVTHVASTIKESVTVSWHSGGADVTGMHIQASVVEIYPFFWVDLITPLT